MKAGYSHNTALKTSEVVEFTPPIFADDSHEVAPTVVTLVRRLLDMADEGADHLTPLRKATLLDVLSKGSIQSVARLTKTSEATVSSRCHAAIRALVLQIEQWQRLKDQSQRIGQLEAEVEQLRQAVGKYGQCPSESGMRPADEALQKKLSRSLDAIALPAPIPQRLRQHRLYTVFDVVRLPMDALEHLETLTPSDLSLIQVRLHQMGLSLGMDVAWSQSAGKYFVRI